MKRIKLTAFLLFMFISNTFLTAQGNITNDIQKMQWFIDAKLGIFIHWGIYAVNGIDESWSFYNGYISYQDYLKQLEGFTADEYDPDKWAKIIKQSGAKYAVLTSKHHDGVALWPTKLSDLNVVEKTPAGRDLIGPFCRALRKQEIKVGLYFSHLDWSHPDYPHFTGSQKRYDINHEPKRWADFVEFRNGQIEELALNYHPDLFWFDGDWDFSAEEWKAKELREMILSNLPDAIINSRLNGYGDYATPEQGVPVVRPQDRFWELCMTMNDSWGYQGNDLNYKTPNQIIRIFIDCISRGGNLLLDIGPMANGIIPKEQLIILEKMGNWVHKHAEAIYGTSAGIPYDHFSGPTTLSKDQKNLFLFLDHKPIGPVVLKGIKNKVNRIRVVGNGIKLSWKIMGKQYWSENPGLLYIDIPDYALDDQVTVIALQLDEPIELFRENQ
ncbi:MAG: alpha-L-fucosidase [Candidatus Aminicenantes bacterium]|nr:alpha-L-fucosidase [Candidatus Aminicenantes bacterium]